MSAWARSVIFLPELSAVLVVGSTVLTCVDNRGTLWPDLLGDTTWQRKEKENRKVRQGKALPITRGSRASLRTSRRGRRTNHRARHMSPLGRRTRPGPRSDGMSDDTAILVGTLSCQVKG